MYACTKNKCDDKKDNFYGALERVLDQLTLLGDFSAKAGRVDIFKMTIGN
jgi:hypothetical protein